MDKKKNIYIIRNGLDFEKAVQDWIAAIGFRCELTPQSGDQGVDIVVHCPDLARNKIAVQCKFYEEDRQVGNDAVQQVFAGKAFWGCADSIVVTNVRFTRAAQELAEKTKTILLHHSQIGKHFSGVRSEIHNAKVDRAVNDIKHFKKNLGIQHLDDKEIFCGDFIVRNSKTNKSVVVLFSSSRRNLLNDIRIVRTCVSFFPGTKAVVIGDDFTAEDTQCAALAKVKLATVKEFDNLLDELDKMKTETPKQTQSTIKVNIVQNTDPKPIEWLGTPSEMLAVLAQEKRNLARIQKISNNIYTNRQYFDKIKRAQPDLLRLFEFIAEFQHKTIIPKDISVLFNNATELSFAGRVISRDHIISKVTSTRCMNQAILQSILDEVEKAIQ